MTAYVLILLALILANGVFAMSEIALVSARRTRLQQMADAGAFGARIALDLAASPGRFLATIQINVTLIGIVTGALGGATLAREVEPSLTDLPVIGAHSATAAMVIVIAVITYVTLVVGELAPKRLGLRYSETVAAVISPLMKMLSVLAAPAVWLLNRSENLLTAPLRSSRPSSEEVNREEIALLMDQWSDAGVLTATERELAEGLMELGERTVESMLKPRPDVRWIDIEMDDEALKETVLSTDYSVLPVAAGSLDRVVGSVDTRDLLLALVRGEPLDLREQMEQPLLIPSSASALNLIEAFGDRHTQMAIAIDEHGVPEGIITLTDMMQAMVGPLAPLSKEYSSRLQRVEAERWEVDAMISLDEFQERLGMEIPPDDRAHFQTVAGLVLNILGDIPEEGDAVRYRDITLHVDRMDGPRIDQVTVTRDSDEQQPQTEGESEPTPPAS